MQIVNFKEYGSVRMLAVNFHTSWTYVGRENTYYGLPESPLANIYRESNYGRAGCIRKYRQWLWWKIQRRDTEVLDALKKLTEDSALVCWCAPKPCHAEVIAKAWAYCKKEGLI
jgi:hypothetical protein